MNHRQYTCFCVVIIVTAALVRAEPPVPNGGSSIVSQRLLDRVADIIAAGGDGSARSGPQGNEGASIVDKELLDRVARIISQNDGQTSWSQKSQAQPNERPSGDLTLPDEGYGVPPKQVPESARELVGSQFELSPPEPVPRIAAFDFTDDEDFSSGYTHSQVPGDYSYADHGNLYQSSGQVGKLQLRNPETAVRIASFDIQGEQPPAPYTPPQARDAYHRRR